VTTFQNVAEIVATLTMIPKTSTAPTIIIAD